MLIFNSATVFCAGQGFLYLHFFVSCYFSFLNLAVTEKIIIYTYIRIVAKIFNTLFGELLHQLITWERIVYKIVLFDIIEPIKIKYCTKTMLNGFHVTIMKL